MGSSFDKLRKQKKSAYGIPLHQLEVFWNHSTYMYIYTPTSGQIASVERCTRRALQKSETKSARGSLTIRISFCLRSRPRPRPWIKINSTHGSGTMRKPIKNNLCSLRLRMFFGEQKKERNKNTKMKGGKTHNANIFLKIQIQHSQKLANSQSMAVQCREKRKIAA